MKIGRPRTLGEGSQQITIRLPRDLLERLDRHVDRVRGEQPGLSVTRADAARMLLIRALPPDDVEESSKLRLTPGAPTRARKRRG